DNTVSVLLGNGDGTFQNGRASAAGAGPNALITGDFNADGKLDVATIGASVNLLLGNGDGTFQTPAAFAAGTNPVAGVVADFNGDGRADLAIANSGSSNISILLGAGPLAVTTATLPGGMQNASYATTLT